VPPASADAVQEEDERPATRDGEGYARRGPGEERFQCYSAFAPEIFTAWPRFSRSVFMKLLKSSGELPTTS